jgi:hypothetical protein
MAVEHAAVTAWAIALHTAAAATVAGVSFTAAAWSRRVLVDRHMTRLAAGTTGINTGIATDRLSTLWIDRSAASGRKHR